MFDCFVGCWKDGIEYIQFGKLCIQNMTNLFYLMFLSVDVSWTTFTEAVKGRENCLLQQISLCPFNRCISFLVIFILVNVPHFSQNPSCTFLETLLYHYTLRHKYINSSIEIENFRSLRKLYTNAKMSLKY